MERNILRKRISQGEQLVGEAQETIKKGDSVKYLQGLEELSKNRTIDECTTTTKDANLTRQKPHHPWAYSNGM